MQNVFNQPTQFPLTNELILDVKIDEIIQKLKILNLDNDPADEVRQLLRQVGNIGYILVTFHPGKVLMRARPNADASLESRWFIYVDFTPATKF